MARVLVVDDSATVRRVVRRALEEAGHEVSLAEDGQRGLERAQSEVPDLVLVDFVMPNMNGLKLCQSLRAIDNLEAVPVVLMSAKADKIGEGFLAQTGAVDAITKPFAPEALLAVAEHALVRHRATSTEIYLGAEGAPERASSPPSDSNVYLVGDSALPEATRDGAAAPERLEAAAAAVASRLDGALADIGVEGGVALLARHGASGLFALIEELHALLPGRDGEVAISGLLEHIPLGDVLQLLQQLRQTGVLEVERGRSRSRAVSICLREGAVDLAIGHGSEQDLRLGRYFLREELIDREDLERILANRRASRAGARTGSEPGLLGTHLLKLGYVSLDDLRAALTAQTSELIYEALRWRRGRYRFARFASRPEAEAARLGLPLAAVLMEGLRRVDEWRLIQEQVRSFDDVPRRDAEALEGVDVARMRDEERRVLDAIDGERDVRAVIEETRLSAFEACKVLFSLVTSRLVRIGPPRA